MKEFTYENQGSNTYLVYQIKPEDEVDSMSLGMLSNNKISGFASLMFTQMDSAELLKYNITSKVAVRQFFEGKVNKKQLISVFRGIVNAFISAEDYMIDPDTIVCDLDYLFVDLSSYETVVVCLPITNKTSKTDLGQFFKTVLFGTQFDPNENSGYVAKIISCLNSNPVFKAGEFKKVLDEIEGIQAVSARPAQATEPAYRTPQPQASVQPVQPQIQQPVQQAQPIQAAQPAVAPVRPVSAPVPQVQQPQVPVQPMQPQAPKMPGGNVAIPGARVLGVPAQQPAAPAQPIPKLDKKDEISMFYLLQHYNKENAAKYKAQQEIKKQIKAASAGASSSKSKSKKSQPAPKKGAPMPGGVAIPGQAQPIAPVGGAKPAGVAIPGMAAPVTPMSGAPQAAPAMAQPQVRPVQPQAAGVQPVPPVMTPMPQAMPQGVPVNFGETTVLGGGSIGETTVLDMTPPAKIDKPYLLRIKNGEKIYVDKSIFRIGKEKSAVDYFIGDNPAISRNHASIICRAGVYYITDLNSTNHTYVNGEKLAGNVETKLDQGAKIRLANEEFEFKLV